MLDAFSNITHGLDVRCIFEGLDIAKCGLSNFQGIKSVERGYTATQEQRSRCSWKFWISFCKNRAAHRIERLLLLVSHFWTCVG